MAFRLCIAAILFAAISLCAVAGGNVIEYTYDAAGNITHITRQSSSGLTVTDLSPNSGPVGTSVTVYGAAFSTTPANNVVKFNGVVATVLASDSGSLSTSVPSGATTGRVTVTVGGVTATSGQDFVVTIPGVPTVASFTPASGGASTSVSVVGTNFDTASGATVVKLNGTSASASVSSTTSLEFVVPPSTGSGRISVTTPGGAGSSAQDFIVPPPGLAATDIGVWKRVHDGAGSVNVSLYSQNKHALLLFDGVLDTFYSLQFFTFESSPTSAVFAYKVYRPDNTLLVQGTVGNASRPSIHLPKLPISGTYTVLLSPGLATLNTEVLLYADPMLTVDGPSSSSPMNFPYQSARWIFDAAAGQRIGIGVAGVTATPAGAGNTAFKVTQPNGQDLIDGALPSCAGPNPNTNPQGNCDGEMLAAASGTFQLFAQSPSGGYASFGLSLNGEVGGTLVAETPQAFTLARVGQDARLSFTAAAGESAAIKLFGISSLPQAQNFGVNIYKPDGTSFVSCTAAPPGAAYCELGVLAAGGAYAIWIDPAVGAYGTFNASLTQGSVLSPTDAAQSFAPSVASEPTRYRFDGTGGQNLTIAITDLVNVTGSGSTSITVYRPDRSILASTASCSANPAGGRCRLSLVNLPLSGTYSIAVTPQSGARPTGNVRVSTDITGVLTAGTSVALSADRAGQAARYSFAGSAGESVAVKLFGVSTSPANQTMYVTVYRPDGNYLSSAATTGGNSAIVNLASLPATGNYIVLVEPATAQTWSGQLLLDPGTLIVIDGAMPTLATTTAGEPLRFRFAGTAGQRVEFGVGGLTYAAASASATGLTVYRPDGNSVASVSCGTSGTGSCETVTASLPSSGTYSIVVSPPSSSSINGGSLAASTPATGAFAIGDPAQTISIARPGQTARFTFSGSAAQLLRLGWSSASVAGTGSVALSVLKPDGSTLSTGSFANGSTGSLDIPSLPVSGTYTVIFDPAAGATMSVPASLSTR